VYENNAPLIKTETGLIHGVLSTCMLTKIMRL